MKALLPMFIYCVTHCTCVLVSCTGLKSRPRPGPQIWFEAQARPGPATAVKTRPGPGPARKLNYEARARSGPQQVCPGPARPAKQFNMWGPDPARARGPRAGLLARLHRHTKQQFYYCVHIIMWLLSCCVRNHMHFQCLCEGCRANETRCKWTRSIFSVPMRRVPIGRVPMRRVPNRRVYYIQWRSQGGPWPPPQTFGKCFFSAMNWCCYVEVARKCKKLSRNWGNLSDLHP